MLDSGAIRKGDTRRETPTLRFRADTSRRTCELLVGSRNSPTLYGGLPSLHTRRQGVSGF